MTSRIPVTELEDGALLVTMPTEITAATDLAICARLGLKIADGHSRLFLDLSATTQIDTEGLRTLKAVRTDAVHQGGDIYLFNVPSGLADMVLTPHTGIGRVYRDLDEARAAAAAQTR